MNRNRKSILSNLNLSKTHWRKSKIRSNYESPFNCLAKKHVFGTPGRNNFRFTLYAFSELSCPLPWKNNFPKTKNKFRHIKNAFINSYDCAVSFLKFPVSNCKYAHIELQHNLTNVHEVGYWMQVFSSQSISVTKAKIIVWLNCSRLD